LPRSYLREIINHKEHQGHKERAFYALLTLRSWCSSRLKLFASILHQLDRVAGLEVIGRVLAAVVLDFLVDVECGFFHPALAGVE
jgi:hypothetical protein